ncbi:propionyl-coenzyme A carboxylase alpha polypeptide [Mesorhizobium sp. M7A.F.Ca.CA.001.09.2.1]|nr:propionyl-coenzyme A carboxylase alpha polypeptide [Mesorhizobium sp. M7A.F.Ca.CA.001.13.2.1]RUY67831.1 propionyl-coenzyme A carboxylase alpha polypeptide [Mesorhizobium sp. M7A.F.Ca.CA.001.13.1.1]RUY70133.1 propionyl-coenzyme A carboxylase alpha polypeptide [Mesorhizobium sp. M7A.F.Ca.CA.001.05.1.1]RUY78625.1 propionyl-coenzyme A carboxylase alpha polypeptide [Mesorhizobium sp. M7A.F.Ca.CA.001.09.2.1]RUZ06131.1 propionyl-coenzyme A carboxylase alpha polypeptide [Mesorhizobium sp. M7A.F.Ca.C
MPGNSPSRREITPLVAFGNYQCRKVSGTAKLPISPLEGEMAGRPEGASLAGG